MTPFWRKREDPEHRRLAERLATLPLFTGIGREALQALAATLHWQQLPAGELLFDQGDNADALYLLIYGRLIALHEMPNGDWRHVGSVVSGHAVGETALLTDRPRNARVVALRDSELLRLDRADFEALLAQHPQPMLRLARAALRRYSEDQQQPPLPRCFAVLPATPGVDVASFARDFAAALGGETPPELIAPSPTDTSAAPGGREERSARLIYLGNDDASWNERCARQSDVVLFLADATQEPDRCQRLPLPQGHSQIERLLVLKGHDAIRHGSTRQWLDAFPAASQAVHLRDDAAMARLGRRLSGRATGLVLSGGGARGFAHLGALRALREAGHAIDYVGGSSIGAIMGAGVSCGWDDDWLREVNYRNFVISKPVSDWTLPLVSLYGGRRVVRLLREAFGERDIEDLPIPFFCCSSSLTSGRLIVHERGRLWQWLRAASAIPGVLPPVLSGGEVLVDGGVIDNLPVREMRERVSGRVFAVDAGGDNTLQTSLEEFELPPWWQLLPRLWRGRQRPRITQILLRAGMVNSDATTRRWSRHADLLIRPSLPDIDLLNWKAFDRAYDAGYRAAAEALEKSDEADKALIGHG